MVLKYLLLNKTKKQISFMRWTNMVSLSLFGVERSLWSMQQDLCLLFSAQQIMNQTQKGMFFTRS